MSDQLGDLRIGTSGYQYDHWVGVLYDEELSKDEWFDAYADTFDTVEINNTFYNLPESCTFDAGRDVYVYFNNNAEGHVVRNAIKLREMLT